MSRIYPLIFSVIANLSQPESFSVAKTVWKKVLYKNWDNYDKIMSYFVLNPAHIVLSLISSYGDHSYLVGAGMGNGYLLISSQKPDSGFILSSTVKWHKEKARLSLRCHHFISIIFVFM